VWSRVPNPRSPGSPRRARCGYPCAASVRGLGYPDLKGCVRYLSPMVTVLSRLVLACTKGASKHKARQQQRRSFFLGFFKENKLRVVLRERTPSYAPKVQAKAKTTFVLLRLRRTKAKRDSLCTFVRLLSCACFAFVRRRRRRETRRTR